MTRAINRTRPRSAVLEALIASFLGGSAIVTRNRVEWAGMAGPAAGRSAVLGRV